MVIASRDVQQHVIVSFVLYAECGLNPIPALYRTTSLQFGEVLFQEPQRAIVASLLHLLQMLDIAPLQLLNGCCSRLLELF